MTGAWCGGVSRGGSPVVVSGVSGGLRLLAVPLRGVRGRWWLLRRVGKNQLCASRYCQCSRIVVNVLRGVVTDVFTHVMLLLFLLLGQC